MLVNNFMHVSNAKTLLAKKCEKFDVAGSGSEPCSVKNVLREERAIDVSGPEVVEARWRRAWLASCHRIRFSDHVRAVKVFHSLLPIFDGCIYVPVQGSIEK